MDDFLDFTRDDSYQKRQLRDIARKKESANRKHIEKIETYEWMEHEIEAELARRRQASTTGTTDINASKDT